MYAGASRRELLLVASVGFALTEVVSEETMFKRSTGKIEGVFLYCRSSQHFLHTPND